PMEALLYVLVLCFGLLITRGVSRLVLFPLLAGFTILAVRYHATFRSHGTGGSLLNVPLGSLMVFAVPFTIGMILYFYRDRIRLLAGPAIALILLWIVVNGLPVYRYALPLALAYGTIYLAHHWPARIALGERWIFGSYGVYIWGFPVQQLIVYAGVRQAWLLMLLSVPAAYACGVVSWSLVEKPTFRLRRWLFRGQPRVPAPRATRARRSTRSLSTTTTEATSGSIGGSEKSNSTPWQMNTSGTLE
ncbi:MAG: acyltransferase family protein, partial [Sciscionella sp.]